MRRNLSLRKMIPGIPIRRKFLEEGVAGHRERNDIVVYENGAEVSRELAHQKIMTAAKGSSCGAWNDRAADIH